MLYSVSLSLSLFFLVIHGAGGACLCSSMLQTTVRCDRVMVANLDLPPLAHVVSNWTVDFHFVDSLSFFQVSGSLVTTTDNKYFQVKSPAAVNNTSLSIGSVISLEMIAYFSPRGSDQIQAVVFNGYTVCTNGCPYFLDSSPVSCHALNDTCYCVAPYSVSWETARSYCQSYRMRLVDMDGLDETAKIVNLINGRGYNISSFWTSGYNSPPSGYWTWNTTGLAIAHSNWAMGQPSRGPFQNCLAVMTGTWKWHGLDCGTFHSIVCEGDYVH